MILFIHLIYSKHELKKKMATKCYECQTIINFELSEKESIESLTILRLDFISVDIFKLVINQIIKA